MKNKYSNESIWNSINKTIDNLLLSKWLYIIIGISFITIFAFIFKWGTIIEWQNPNYVVDNELLGTFGDFIGGVLGTFFSIISIIVVVKTFSHQRKVTEDNEKQLETQRFNDLFFELLRLYQSEVNELCGQYDLPKAKRENDQTEIESTEIVYNNKDFFDFEKEMLQQSFQYGKSFENNRKNSLSFYMLFYIKNRTKMGAYFRTLYRIYDLIDNALIDEKSKKNYLKIMRAQLTESELFFIRYNALSYYGQKFIKYINKYHILKHLPTFELLEFKDWWEDLNPIERTGINIVFDELNYLLRKMLEEGHSFTRSNDNNAKYNFTIIIKSNYDVEIVFYIDQNKENKALEYSALEKFNSKRIQQLLDCFIKEIFLYSNFNKYNNKNIETYSDHILQDGDIIVINSGIRNLKKEPLVLKRDFQ